MDGAVEDYLTGHVAPKLENTETGLSKKLGSPYFVILRRPITGATIPGI